MSISYCSREHQIAHRDAHKSACTWVKRARLYLGMEEQILRDRPANMFLEQSVFEVSAGHFWGIHATRDYMRARFILVEATLKTKHYDAAQAALDHLIVRKLGYFLLIAIRFYSWVLVFRLPY